MPKAGDKISCREWTGKPYRSIQRILKESVIVSVLSFRMNDFSFFLDEYQMTDNEMYSFALADGFKSAQEMFDWFAKTHGLPFSGIVIYWKP